jgi:hypothetical protein
VTIVSVALNFHRHLPFRDILSSGLAPPTPREKEFRSGLNLHPGGKRVP